MLFRSRNSRSVLSGREPCRGLASLRGRVLKSRISAGQKLSLVKTWAVRIWAVAEGIADGRLTEGRNNVTVTHPLLSVTPHRGNSLKIGPANITITSGRSSYSSFYRILCAINSVSRNSLNLNVGVDRQLSGLDASPRRLRRGQELCGHTVN